MDRFQVANMESMANKLKNENRKQKSPQCSIFSIKNKWIRLNKCQHLQNSKFSYLWDFDKVEDDINSYIAFLQRKQ